VDWTRYGNVVIRSCWDYHERVSEFRAWTRRMQEEGVALQNSAAVVTWNMDKHYLAELAAQGIPTVPTIWLKWRASVSLAAVLATEGWTRAVVKPTISASTWATDVERAAGDQAALDALLRTGDVMVQKFMPQIETEGEWSLMFFGKVYSHAVLKTPAAGEFRIQSEYGGSTLARVPSPMVIAQAEKIVRAVAEPLLYARVDGVVANGEFVLMELELIEPFLFLGTAPGSAERFADAILQV
jgi:hypothetical protein